MNKEIEDLKIEIKELDNRLKKIEELIFSKKITDIGLFQKNLDNITTTNELNQFTNNIILNIDRTDHVKIYNLSKIQDMALYVLLIAKKIGYSGLIPQQISEILKIKFQLDYLSDSIDKALNRAKEFVDRKIFTNKIGKLKFYYIISPKGEKYIINLFGESNNE